jgi:hypothetical protein
MIYEILDVIETRWLKRLFASFGLLLVPVFIVLAVLWGALMGAVSLIARLFGEAVVLVRYDVPQVLSELFITLKTGVHPFDQA